MSEKRSVRMQQPGTIWHPGTYNDLSCIPLLGSVESIPQVTQVTQVTQSILSCTLELGVFDSVFEENATDTFAAHPSIHTSSSSIIYPSITTTPSIRKRVSVRVSTTSPEDICDLNKKKPENMFCWTDPSPNVATQKEKRQTQKKLSEFTTCYEPSKKEKRKA